MLDLLLGSILASLQVCWTLHSRAAACKRSAKANNHRFSEHDTPEIIKLRFDSAMGVPMAQIHQTQRLTLMTGSKNFGIFAICKDFCCILRISYFAKCNLLMENR